MIAFRNHQAARDRPDAALDKVGVMIEDKTVDAGVAQPGLRPGQADDIVRPKELFQVGKPVYSARLGRWPTLDWLYL